MGAWTTWCKIPNDKLSIDTSVYVVHNMHTIETGSNYKLYEESMYKKRLLSIAIISPMRKSQRNKLQKLSVSRNESMLLQIQWLWSEWYVECVICFEVSFQMSRATHKYIQEHNACLIPGWDALLTLLENLNFFPNLPISPFIWLLWITKSLSDFN